MTHLIKNNCSDECDVWCDEYLTTPDQTTEPEKVTCERCLFAAESYAKAIVRRVVAARFVKAHGLTLDQLRKP